MWPNPEEMHLKRLGSCITQNYSEIFDGYCFLLLGSKRLRDTFDWHTWMDTIFSLKTTQKSLMDIVFFSLAARGSETSLNWHTWMEIAIGAGRGLAYLRSNEKVITSSNILLDAYMNAKIADFGLSRLMTIAANFNVIATADDLLCATAEVMGKSTNGTVYKATLEDGNQAAMSNLREQIAKCQREFETEASALGKIRDINLLVSLEDQRYFCLFLRAYY